VVGLPIPGRAGRDFRAANHLCPDQRQGRQPWAEWLEEAYSDGRVPTAYGRASKASG
jgi:hypothetical protein